MWLIQQFFKRSIEENEDLKLMPFLLLKDLKNI